MTPHAPTPLEFAIADLEREHGTARLLPTSERRQMATLLGLPAGRALVDCGDGRYASVDPHGDATLHDLKAPIQ